MLSIDGDEYSRSFYFFLSSKARQVSILYGRDILTGKDHLLGYHYVWNICYHKSWVNIFFTIFIIILINIGWSCHVFNVIFYIMLHARYIKTSKQIML